MVKAMLSIKEVALHPERVLAYPLLIKRPVNATMHSRLKGGTMLMAKTFLPFLDTPLANRIWQISTAIAAGTGGTIVLTYFMSGLVSMDTMASLLDWIVGFNTALTGYMLMDKSEGRIRWWRWLCASAGLVNAVLCVVAVNYIYASTMDLSLVDRADAGILLTIGAVCGALGGLLAKKYLALKEKTGR